MRPVLSGLKVELPPYEPDHPVTRADRAAYLDAATELVAVLGGISFWLVARNDVRRNEVGHIPQRKRVPLGTIGRRVVAATAGAGPVVRRALRLTGIDFVSQD